jgi:hypothetical protein
MSDNTPGTAPKPFSAEYRADGRTVAAGRGWDWIVEGFALFRKRPGIWMLMAVALAALFILISMIPVVGSFASALLFPVFGGSLMLGCRDLERDGPFEFEHLFAGFKQKTGDPVMLGAFNLFGWVVIFFAVAAVIGGGAVMGLTRGGIEGAGISLAAMLIATLLVAGLSMPLYMATWFAPALIVLQGMSTGAALKASFFACLRNWMPFLVYSLALLVLCVIAAIPLGLVLFALGVGFAIPLGLGYLVLIPVLAASVYTAYRDIFDAA